jgi:hypothetical protein
MLLPLVLNRTPFLAVLTSPRLFRVWRSGTVTMQTSIAQQLLTLQKLGQGLFRFGSMVSNDAELPPVRAKRLQEVKEKESIYLRTQDGEDAAISTCSLLKRFGIMGKGSKNPASDPRLTFARKKFADSHLI